MAAWAAVWSFGWFAGPRSSDVGQGRIRRAPVAQAPVSASSSIPELHAPNVDTASIDARDAAWMSLIAHDDVTAFRALFDAYAVPLVRLATGYVRANDVAQDIVQDVFITIWERRASLSITGRVASYLAVATRNHALKAIRSASRATRWEQESVSAGEMIYPVAQNLGDASLEAEEFRAALRGALESMPERQREVFLLHREQGLDYPTIAAALGVTVPSVHNTMSRALARLRDALRRVL